MLENMFSVVRNATNPGYASHVRHLCAACAPSRPKECVIAGAWARTMSQAMDHYCKYLITACNKNRWSEAKATVQQLLDECIHGFLKEGVNYKKLQTIKSSFGMQCD